MPLCEYIEFARRAATAAAAILILIPRCWQNAGPPLSTYSVFAVQEKTTVSYVKRIGAEEVSREERKGRQSGSGQPVVI